jgi:hypothetical protein
MLACARERLGDEADARVCAWRALPLALTRIEYSSTSTLDI